MDSAALGLSTESLDRYYTRPNLYKWKTYGFLVAIIVGLGLLAVGATGVSGYCQVGSLSHMAQVDAITMMAAGVAGIILLTIGIVGFVKNCKAVPQEPPQQVSSKPKTTVKNESESSAVHVQTKNKHSNQQQPTYEFRNPTSCASEISTNVVSDSKIKDELIYGPEAWKCFDVKVLDKVPDPPQVPWDDNDSHFQEPFRNNYVLLYIPEKYDNAIQHFQMPERWQHCRKEQSGKDMTLGEFEIRLKSSKYSEYYSIAFPNFVSPQFMGIMQPGWSLISTRLVPGTIGQDFKTLESLIEAQKGFEMPTVFEAFALNALVYARTKKMPYGPETYTYCKGQSEPHLVGFDYVYSTRRAEVPPQLWLTIDTKQSHTKHCQDGAAVVLRDFERWKTSKASATEK